MGIAGTPYGYNEQQQLPEQNQYQQQAQPMYDEAGFADAFEQASQHVQEMAKEGTGVDRTVERVGSDLLHKDAIPINPSHFDYDLSSLRKPPSPSQIRIGSDAIPYHEHKIRAPDQDSRDADELARTAGQLLTSVQHETSNKFQNSQFLALMRKIRDGEVRVQGEEFKEIYGNDNMVSRLSGSIVHRAEKEFNLLRPPPVPIRIVPGFDRAEVIRPTHAHDGQLLDYSNPKHRKYVANLCEQAIEFISTGHYDIEFAPGSVIASDPAVSISAQ